MVRVRFAPSPTGMLHVGSLRSALYNYLFARHHGGKCILRIEDTDQTRYVEGAEQNILDMFAWTGIEFDEGPHVGGPFGPYRQSERTELYRHHAQILLDRGTAYYAFDTPEELERMRERQQQAGVAPKYDRTSMRNQFTLGEEETRRLLDSGADRVIRLFVPLTGETRTSDIVRGESVFSNRVIDDQVLLKSDGFPTYHLANIVDDHLMQITHVIRAEEWLPSLPKHVILYDAFGWEKPQFAHLPLLLSPARKKLSKRDGDVAVSDDLQREQRRSEVRRAVHAVDPAASALVGAPEACRGLHGIRLLQDGAGVVRKIDKDAASREHLVRDGVGHSLPVAFDGAVLVVQWIGLPHRVPIGKGDRLGVTTVGVAVHVAPEDR